MSEFDAETYLRLLGERLLQDRDAQRGHRRSPLELPAAALVVAGAIDRTPAQRVIDDHNSALRIRAGGQAVLHLGQPGGRRKRGRITPSQTMVLEHEIAFGDGLLLLRDLAVVSTGGGTLRFRWRSNGARGGRGARIFSGASRTFPWGATPLVIVDDQGNRPVVSSGSGGGSESQWDGELTLTGTLAPKTAWLEVDGTRIPLDRRIAPSQTWSEPIEEGDILGRFLRRRLVVPEMPFHQPVELAPAIDALRAAGALAGREQLVDELERAATQLPGRHGRVRTGSGSTGAGGRRLPEPWRSLLARAGRSDGPDWTRVLGALTPPFDGIQVAFRAVTSDTDGFEAEFEVSPNVLNPPALGEWPVAWSARDDRGNRYLGSPNRWQGGDESASGTMQFWPALDPRALRLDLVVSAKDQRGVVAIPLDEAS